jgi:hypothetical protein
VYLKVSDLKDLGVSQVTIWRKISSGEWQSREVGKSRNGKPVREVLLESLPHDLHNLASVIYSVRIFSP